MGNLSTVEMNHIELFVYFPQAIAYSRFRGRMEMRQIELMLISSERIKSYKIAKGVIIAVNFCSNTKSC